MKKQHTSDLLESLIARIAKKRSIRLKDIIKLLEERVFGLAILLFCIPNCLPIPNVAGLSAITGIPIGIIGLEMMIGRTELWLPAFIGAKKIPGKRFASVLKHGVPLIRKMEKFLYPRLRVMSSPVMQRLLGLAFVIQATIMSLPIPFGNMAPGWAMALMAIGLIKRDGIIILLGLLSGAGILIFVFTIADKLLVFLS